MNNLGIRLCGLGRRDEALAPAEEAAVVIRRRLAEANRAAYLPDLAMSLWEYAWICVKVQDDLSHALDAVTEAIGLYTELAEPMRPQNSAGSWTRRAVLGRTSRRRPSGGSLLGRQPPYTSR